MKTFIRSIAWYKAPQKLLRSDIEFTAVVDDPVTEYPTVIASPGGDPLGTDTIYTADGTLAGDRNVYMGGHILSVFDTDQDAENLILNKSTVLIQNSNAAGGNTIYANSSSDNSQVILALTNGGIGPIFNFIKMDAIANIITYSTRGGVHLFDGQVTMGLTNNGQVNLGAPIYPDNAAATAGGLAVGNTYCSIVNGDGFLKAVI